MSTTLFIQDSITVPVAYIEAFILMLGAFLIGYIAAQMYTRQYYKKQLRRLQKMLDTQEEVIASLKTESIEQATPSYRKDRMDQEYEQQLQFHKKAFSSQVLQEKASDDGIDFERIGKVSVDERDDLQQITGIGPYTEAKLNQLGIYTLDQISRFNDEDIDAITTMIKFFPDRIKNDRWVEKAKNLLAKVNTKPQGDLDKLKETSAKKRTPHN